MLLRNKHIYVVEDNVDNIFVILSILRQHGATVTIDWWAKGEVQRIFDAMPIDIILLDLMLPHGRNGFEVFDEIRTAPQLNSVPVVLVTAADASATVPKAVEKGFSGYISKPIDYTLFPQQIAALINGESIWHIE